MQAVRETYGMWRQLTRADRMLVWSLLLAATASFLWINAWAPAGVRVHVEINGQVSGEYPLDTARELSLKGPIGTTVVEIGAGWVRVRSAPCRQQLCRKRGRISRRGEVIVCVPNRLILTVVGASVTVDVDAVVR